MSLQITSLIIYTCKNFYLFTMRTLSCNDGNEIWYEDIRRFTKNGQLLNIFFVMLRSYSMEEIDMFRKKMHKKPVQLLFQSSLPNDIF